jgi:F420H(2)-dependent quinone reductase
MSMTAFPEASAAGRRPAGGRQASIMRAVNVPMRAVLRLPFPTPLSGNLMLISYTGVKSGRAYLQPVSYVHDGDTLLSPGGGRWTLNLKGGRRVRLRLRGRPVNAHADLISDPAEVERLLGVIAAGNPRATRFIPLPRQADGRLEPEPLAAAIAHGFRVVRWHVGAAA